MIRSVKGLVLALIAVVLLSGCAAERLFGEGKELVDAGQYAAGFAKLEEAIKEDPKNPAYRIYLANRREAAINTLLARAELARSQAKTGEAESLYRQALALDARSQPAMIGQEKLAMDQRHRQLAAEVEAALNRDDLKGAGELVRAILSENPGHREARNLELRIHAKQARPELKLAESFRKPITLEFRDAPLRSVFELISRVSGINFVYDKDIRADLKATIFVKNSSIEDAIKLLSVTNQLEYRVLNENSILIYPNTPQKIKDYQPLTVRSFYLANADAKQVANTLKTILKTRDLVINEKLNLLIMRDSPEAIRLAEKVVALEDIHEPEVMLEVEVMEIKRSRIMDLGVKWPEQLTLSTTPPSGGTPLSLFGLRNINSHGINASLTGMVVNARKDDTDTNILANPRIRVKNREKAKILIGDRVPVITTTATSTGFISESVNYVDVGLKLEVEPNIFLDDGVSIKVGLEVSSIVKEVTSKSGSLSYQIGTRNANTVLRLRDGETQVLAGLINDEDRKTANKVPGLGDLPVLGRLFSSHKDDAQKTEIVLSITPRLMRTVKRPDLLMAEFASGTETSLGGRSLSIAAAADTTKPATGGQTYAARDAAEQAKPGAGKPLPAMNGYVALAWQGPQQVRSGDQFGLVLSAHSGALRSGMHLSIAFDPEFVQVTDVMEGDFLRQGGGQTTFFNRVDPIAGRVFVTAARQGAAINAAGPLLTVSLKAVRQVSQTKIQLLSVTPEPHAAEGPILLPADFDLAIN